MREIRISRRRGLAALGATLGAALLGTSLADQAKAAPRAGSSPTGVSTEEADAYTLTINNDSDLDEFNAILFQQMPELPNDAVSLAWLSKMCHAHTTLEYQWSVDYCFVWGQVGKLVPGTQFVAGQTVDANLKDNNYITLSYKDGGFEFDSPSAKEEGYLIIQEDGSVPGDGDDAQGSVGVGMSGAGTFVVPTQKFDLVQFTPKPTYWVAFGSFQSGEVMDIAQLIQPAEVQYPAGTSHAKASFDGANWTITYD